ncbi:hypothetical protein SHIRM173S_03540 [Streptomyces hirsutus]
MSVSKWKGGADAAAVMPDGRFVRVRSTCFSLAAGKAERPGARRSLLLGKTPPPLVCLAAPNGVKPG